MKEKAESDKRSYSHKFNTDIYALSFSSKPSYKHRLAVGSFQEKDSNKVNHLWPFVGTNPNLKKGNRDPAGREERRICWETQFQPPIPYKQNYVDPWPRTYIKKSI